MKPVLSLMNLHSLSVALALLCAWPVAAKPALTLEKGDRISLIGNSLAERMQHFGHWETLLHQRFPEHNLVVRNLAFPADELFLRPRSANFGSADEHLARQQTDVVLAFFGFNESFAGPEGLEKFKDDLDRFISGTLEQKYNGKSAPRLALISPIAHENLQDPNFPDGQAGNKNLLLYTEAMAEAARKHKIGFVDLFNPTLELFAQSPERLTINGVHLSDNGYSKLAPILDGGLFGKEGAPESIDQTIRAEVNDKNFQFYQRYRALNGYYIYGGRSRLEGQEPKNHLVLERERDILDEMTAIREKRIWALSQGKDVPAQVDDSGVSPQLEVRTNFKQPVRYLSPREALESFKLAPGYAINCFASEEDFPELANPAQIAFDSKGRLWVMTMPSYPHARPGNPPDDKILILEDTTGDGKADKMTVFADKLHVPTGLEIGDGGVYVASQPDLLFLKDTTGDGKADYRERVLQGFDSADSHHSISAFVWDPGGALYFQEGTFHHSQVETPYGPVRLKDAGVFRYEPRTGKFDVFVSYGFANPWGHSWDRWGQNFVLDASGGNNYYGAAFSGHVHYPRKQKTLKQFIKMRVRPTSGGEFVSSRHFPPEAQGNLLLNNTIGFQGVLQHTMKEDQSGFIGTEIEPLLESSDRNFRPVDLEFGPDGALYICDWHNVLVGHMQHNLRDPLRDTTHGRIWRISYPSRPLVKPPRIAGEPVEKLLDLLKTHEDRTRHHVRMELRERPTKEVVAALEKWVSELDKNHTDYEHHLLEALWVHQHHNAVNEELLKRVLHSPDHRARAAATRVLCYWRDAVNEPLGLLRVQVNDPHPRVRLEAVRACSFFTTPEAAEVALESLNHPQDEYLEYTLDSTMTTLERYLKY